MKKNIFIFAIAVFMLGGFNLFDAVSNDVYAGTIRICLDDSCPQEYTTCYLYRPESDIPVASCILGANRCCDVQVDRVGYYFWTVTDGNRICYGATFYYNGEAFYQVNFTCDNCP